MDSKLAFTSIGLLLFCLWTKTSQHVQSMSILSLFTETVPWSSWLIWYEILETKLSKQNKSKRWGPFSTHATEKSKHGNVHTRKQEILTWFCISRQCRQIIPRSMLDNVTILKIKCLHPNGRPVKSTTIRFKNVPILTHFSNILKQNAQNYPGITKLLLAQMTKKPNVFNRKLQGKNKENCGIIRDEFTWRMVSNAS